MRMRQTDHWLDRPHRRRSIAAIKHAVHGEYVENLAVRENISLMALDDLVYP